MCDASAYIVQLRSTIVADQKFVTVCKVTKKEEEKIVAS